MSFASFINTCLNYLPVRCVLCGFSAQQAYNLCTPCFNSCRVYAEQSHDAHSPIFAVSPYREPVMQMIRKLKFNQQLIFAKPLGMLLASKVREEWYQERRLPDRLIPVPLHPLRLRERGFNQALEIGRHVARELGLIMDSHSAVRIKATLAQSGLTKTARQRNMQGAFACHARLDGLSVAILDDVVTTGQTVAELSQVLQEQGAANIDIWCCARA